MRPGLACLQCQGIFDREKCSKFFKFDAENGSDSMSLDKLFGSKKFLLKVAGMWPEECERMPKYSWFKLYLNLVVDVILIIMQAIGTLTVATPENISE